MVDFIIGIGHLFFCWISDINHHEK